MNDTHHELAEWMDNYMDGDDRAFRALHGYLAPRLRGRLLRLLQSEAMVDDVVQQTFMRAHLAKERFVAEGEERSRAVEGWYFAIARNTALDALRQNGRTDRRHDKMAAAGEVAALGAAYVAPDPERAQLEREASAALVGRVHAAIEQLPVAQAQVVRLHKLAELPMQEVADELGINPGAVRVRAHRAYRALTRLLAPQATAEAAVGAHS